jgi:3-oxoacyl-[acyl-carrier-protein] synthase-1
MVPVAIQACGLVTSVGLHPSSACASMRCRLNNFQETAFQLSSTAKVVGATVPEISARGVDRLFAMVRDAIGQALESLSDAQRQSTPLILCLAESGRPGRLERLEDRLFDQLYADGVGLHPESRMVLSGKVGVAAALEYASQLLHENKAQHVIVAATDSLLNQQTVQGLLKARRVGGLFEGAGLIPGEGAGALLVSKLLPNEQRHIRVLGYAEATEPARLDNDEAVKGHGLKQSIEAALAVADLSLSDIGLRVADLAGDPFYFEDAATAMVRVAQESQTPMELWIPAESVGETGAAVGTIGLAWLLEAAQRGYTSSRYALCHYANDDGRRAALIVEIVQHRAE